MTSPIEIYAAIKAMRESTAWKLFIDRYSKEGDKILTQILDTELSDNGVKYTKRDLYVHQLAILGKVGEVLDEFEIDARNEEDANKVRKHVGN